MTKNKASNPLLDPAKDKKAGKKTGRKGISQAKVTQQARLKALQEKMQYRSWRLDNLYHIINKDGARIKFQMNAVQRDFLKNNHSFNIILKARQLGFSTFICLYMLDACLFNKNKQAGIIAHTLVDAKKLLEKIKYAYDNLPDSIKAVIATTADNKTDIAFNNGSAITVGTSMRGGTLQYLLVSEFGKICARMPDKAKEIIAGSLNTLDKGQNCWIESTAEGQSGYFYDMCQDAQAKVRRGESLGELDFKFHFYPWYIDKGYRLASDVVSEECKAYFADLKQNYGLNIDLEAQAWYSAKKITLTNSIYSEYPTTPDEAFKASLEGCYYQNELNSLESLGRIKPFEYEPLLPCQTFWDLGMNDATAIIIAQHVSNEVRIIDYIEGQGEGLQHYIKQLSSLPYTYSAHFAPHDIQVRELGTGVSRLETAYKLGLQFKVTPNIPVIDGINAVRQALPKTYFRAGKTDRLIDCLRNYRKEWDERNGVWKDNPKKSEFNHGADAMRYLAVNLFTNQDNFVNTKLGQQYAPSSNQQVAEGVSFIW